MAGTARMSDLRTFERDLEAVIGKPTGHRPFICEGSPLGCQVLIVGANPATGMESGFWDFWSTDEGFDKKRWWAAYLRERAERAAEGKRKNRRVSTSRAIIERVVASAGSGVCLETNVYSWPSKRLKDLPKEKRTTAAFEMLVRYVAPRLLIVHGGDAVKVVRRLKPSAEIWERPHFAYQWSHDRADQLGLEIRSHLGLPAICEAGIPTPEKA